VNRLDMIARRAVLSRFVRESHAGAVDAHGLKGMARSIVW
jgi:hypothetical protein